MGLTSPYKPSRLISPLKARQLHRALKNLKLSLICGLLTILVLRGALGAGKYGTPAKDFEEIKHQFERVHSLHARKHASRVLTEVVEERRRPFEAIEAQAHSAKYDVLKGGKLQSKEEFLDASLDVKSTVDFTQPNASFPKGPDWGAQKRAWLRTHPNSVGNKPKTMLVTGYQHPSACENPRGDHYLLKFVKNKVDYCKLHGIDIIYNSAFLQAELSGFSAKFRLLRKLMLSHPEVEWFWWMDSDVLFTDMAFEVPLEKYEDFNVLLHGWDVMIHKQKNEGGLTSGSFLIRNCKWSLSMIDTWISMEREGRVPIEADNLLIKSLTEQLNPDNGPVFAHLLIDDKRNGGEKIFVEKSILLHGYWEKPSEQSEEGLRKYHDENGNESQPFVSRFVQHKLCKNGANAGGGDKADLYFKSVERALDFADSQVLQLTSDQQKSPSWSALARLRGGHTGLMVSHSNVRPSSPQQSKHMMSDALINISIN